MVSKTKERRKKRSPGRPPKSPADRCVLVTTSVSADLARWLRLVGDGSASRGLRLVAADGFRRSPNYPPAGASGKGD